MKKLFLALVIFINIGLPVLAAIHYVPAQYATIQDAITAATDGDTVSVAPGTYPGSFNYTGKKITIKSSSTPFDTFIMYATIRFVTGETRQSVLNGFTICDLDEAPYGAIYCTNSSPTIVNNIIRNNYTWESGAGLATLGGNPLIVNNIFYDNEAMMSEACSGGSGIFVDYGEPIIVNNLFCGNTNAYGAGMMCCEDDSLIVNNLFVNNHGQAIHGDFSEAKLIHNTFVNNEIGGCYTNFDMFNCLFYHPEQANITDQYGNFYGEPIFVAGLFGPYYLSQLAAGQEVDSPCLNAGIAMSFLYGTTRTDHAPDTTPPDIGFHCLYQYSPGLALFLMPFELYVSHEENHGLTPYKALDRGMH